ncbi:hypothetical protein [Embleya sp. AB8]|uniref:hypothetical protein n=1 Tax=Embleya sp. AB8 TaxID=3156304 RepID=UPI003C77DC7E
MGERAGCTEYAEAAAPGTRRGAPPIRSNRHPPEDLPRTAVEQLWAVWRPAERTGIPGRYAIGEPGAASAVPSHPAPAALRELRGDRVDPVEMSPDEVSTPYEWLRPDRGDDPRPLGGSNR